MNIAIHEGSLEEKVIGKFYSVNNKCVICEDSVKNYHTAYQYRSEDRKLLDLALEQVGTISDCYILYAIGLMGASTVDAIIAFLTPLKKMAPQLGIVPIDNGDMIKARLRRLADAGYLYLIRYVLQKEVNGRSWFSDIAIYTLSESGFSLASQHLQKKIVINSAFQAKPINELIGWAAGAYVGSAIAKNSQYFNKYLERVFRTRQIGAFFFPLEMRMEKEEHLFYVSVMSSFLQYNSMAHTQDDYAELCATKVNMIRNYLSCRTKKGTSHVIMVVRDFQDLQEMAGLICSLPMMHDFLDYIYFTAEGVFREEVEIKKCFLKINKTVDGNFEFVCEAPDYM